MKLFHNQHQNGVLEVKTMCCEWGISMLWHRRLEHISIERIKRLVNEGVLSALDFADCETCADCIKGK